MSIPRIKLVVPTRNSHHLLERLVTSLQQQSWPHWEALFIDGNSRQDHRDWLTNLCYSDRRFSWRPQEPSLPGIFGAMNQGFLAASDHEWLLFWGSDDWAPSTTVFADLVAVIDHAIVTDECPDLIVGWGRYVDLNTGALCRRTYFRWQHTFRSSLFLGSTPPHQATLIGPGSRSRLQAYHPWFRLSGDLDYFLRLSAYPSLQVKLVDLEIVRMGTGGISGQQTLRRLYEVFHAYITAFGSLWWIPFSLRYLYRIRTKWEPDA